MNDNIGDNIASWIRELRRRSHEHGNHISRVEGELTGIRLLMEERHKVMLQAQRDVRDDFKELTRIVNDGFTQLRDEVAMGKVKIGMLCAGAAAVGSIALNVLVSRIS